MSKEYYFKEGDASVAEKNRKKFKWVNSKRNKWNKYNRIDGKGTVHAIQYSDGAHDPKGCIYSNSNDCREIFDESYICQLVAGTIVAKYNDKEFFIHGDDYVIYNPNGVIEVYDENKFEDTYEIIGSKNHYELAIRDYEDNDINPELEAIANDPKLKRQGLLLNLLEEKINCFISNKVNEFKRQFKDLSDFEIEIPKLVLDMYEKGEKLGVEFDLERYYPDDDNDLGYLFYNLKKLFRFSIDDDASSILGVGKELKDCLDKYLERKGNKGDE